MAGLIVLTRKMGLLQVLLPLFCVWLSLDSGFVLGPASYA